MKLITLLFCSFALLLPVFCESSPNPDTNRFDLIITNGRILDGTGNPWFRADVGVRNGRIVAIGDLRGRTATRSIDAHDRIVCPGFIDPMGDDSLPLILDPASAASKLLEGVTTILVGEGESPAPQNQKTIEFLQKQEAQHFTFFWTNYEQYFSLLTKKRIALNVLHNVGAAQVRAVVLGEDDVTPSPAQLEQMEQLVDEAMRQGAVGLSSALIYAPGSYAKTPELIALAKVAAKYGGIYLSHIRNESSGVLGAIQEAIEIGEQAQIPVHIYHLKAAGQENWGLVAKELALIEQARNRGIEVTADAYPYTYNSLDLSALIPPEHYGSGKDTFRGSLSNAAVRTAVRKEIETRTDWENWYVHAGRDWNNVLVVDVPPGIDTKFAGMSIAQIAQARGTDPWTVFFDIVAHGNSDVNCRSQDEEQKREIYSRDFVSVSSDAAPTDPAVYPHVHPRAFGTFPRILSKYVREDHVFTLLSAVRAMTSLPADQLKLYDRGRIAVGMAADIVIFDPDSVQDTATYGNPTAYPKGIYYVLANGNVAVDDGKVTDALAGEVLRYQKP